MGLIAVQRGDAQFASEQYEYLSLMPGVSFPGGGPCTDYVLALLAQTMGNLDDAQTHFEDALAFCRKTGYRPELAWSLCDYADMLLDDENVGAHGRAPLPNCLTMREDAVGNSERFYGPDDIAGANASPLDT